MIHGTFFLPSRLRSLVGTICLTFFVVISNFSSGKSSVGLILLMLRLSIVSLMFVLLTPIATAYKKYKLSTSSKARLGQGDRSPGR